MAKTTENKSLEQIINKFTEASNQTSELDKVISNFSNVIEEFRDTLYLVDDQMKATEMSKLSEQAVERLKEIKSMNEFKILENLESVIKKQLAEQMKHIQKQMNDHKKDSLTKIENQVKQLSITLKDNVFEGKNKEDKVSEQKILSLLQRIENQTRHTGNGSWMGQQNNEEINQLRKLVSNLNRKLKRMEEDYENRISELEMEVELLRSSQENESDPFENTQLTEITDKDLPF